MHRCWDLMRPGRLVGKVRRREHKALRQAGDETLKGTKQLWLFNPENMSNEQWPMTLPCFSCPDESRATVPSPSSNDHDSITPAGWSPDALARENNTVATATLSFELTWIAFE